MTDQSPIAVISGASRGLGFETCRQLGRRGYRVLLTARDHGRGKASADTLQREGLNVEFYPLDVTDADSVQALSEHLERKYGHLDVLINNAGVFLDPMPPEDPSASSVFRADIATLRYSMETNAYGALRLCQALIPLMRGNGRVVNVSSGMGQLSEMNGCCPGYRFSKAAINVLTRILADELRDTRIKVNSVCPGWVRTEMGGPNADRSVEEGADTIVWLATLLDDGPSGGFFRDRKPIPW
jgi:NAD(P)-dependent dehydrogenase (short-subunit alcohol dehydrogenase family)